MNNGDLNRILNKLTAAANPEEFEGVAPSQTVSEKDPCQNLANYQPSEAILAQIQKLFRDRPSMFGLPRRAEISSIFYESVNIYINLVCRCIAHQKLMGTWVPDTVYGQSFSQMVRDITKPIKLSGGELPDSYVNMNNKIKGLCRNLLLGYMKIAFFRGGLDKYCDRNSTGIHLSHQGKALIAAARSYLGQTQGSSLDGLWEDLHNIVTPVTISTCAEPKVAIIEDYLVEQGLAIGVAGILAATALGLYLRGNRAAAVALIATATAAVGGTATGAESVMNDVETDYNRSVRFGGQQDCRDSNQTGNEMSAGD